MRFILRLICIVLITTVVITMTFFTLPVQGAIPTRFGVPKSVKVVGVKFNNIATPRKATCQEWVDLFNQQVSPWFQYVSDNRERYTFELAPYKAGVQHPPGDWISIPYPTTVGYYIDTLNQYVMPTLNQMIDFSAIDQLVIISAGGSGEVFGQSVQGPLPDDPKLASWPLRVSGQREGEFQMEDEGVFHWYRRVAISILDEGTETDPNFIQRMCAVLLHEFGHLYGFPDRYETFVMNGSGRDYATGYSPMALQWDARINALSVHFLAFEQHWMGFAQTAALPLEIPKNTMAQEYDVVYLTAVNPPIGNSSMLKIPVEGSGSTFSDFRGYTVEARKRDTSSMFNDHVLQQGVVVSWIDPAYTSDWHHIKVVDDPDRPANLWDAALEVGDHFEDGGRGVAIDVLGEFANGYRVRVTNTTPATMRPDPSITAWNANYESVDIWIDSPINGYDNYTYTDGNRDAPAIRSSTDDPAIVNRVYYRIRNDGLSTAQNLRTDVSYTLPDISPGSWTLIRSKPIGAIAVGQSVTGYAEWTVPDDFADDEPHACVKVNIVADSSDLNTSNNLAQENILHFETVSGSPWKPKGRLFTVTNPSKIYDARVLLHISGLPAGWAVRLQPSGFPLAAGKSQTVDFMLYPDGGADKRTLDYSAGYLAKVKITAQFDMIIKGHYRTGKVGGINTWLRLTEGTKTSLSIKPDERGGAHFRTCVKRLTGEVVSGAQVSIQYWSGKTVKWASGITSADGCITTNVGDLSPGKWQAKSFYSGTGIYGSSRSQMQAFVISYKPSKKSDR